MGKPGSLAEIIDALESANDEYPQWADRETGNVESVETGLLRMAEKGKYKDGEAPDLPEWQMPEWEVARLLVADPLRFQRLPDQYDIHEWDILRDFAESAEPERVRVELERSIHGRGAFRMFRDTVRRLKLEDAWNAFRATALREIAIEWRQENQLEWRDS